MEIPVKPVDLNLTKFNHIAVCVKEALEALNAGMVGKSQMFDSACFAFRHQILLHSEFRIQIIFDIVFAHIVEQIKVEILRLQLFELFCEDFLNFREVIAVIARELRCQMEALAWITTEGFADNDFGISFVVAPCGIKIVDTVLIRIVEHFKCFFLVNVFIDAVDNRKPHGSESELRNFFAFKIRINHRVSSVFSYFHSHSRTSGIS